MMAVFFCAIIMIAAMAAAPNLLTQGRREKEREMIWRGSQYVRAISLYRRKTGKFPTSLEDLTKGRSGVHFLRKLYKDPFNSDDGAWRLIYVGPAGQLIGSFTQTWNANQVFRTQPAGSPAPALASSASSTGAPGSSSASPSQADPNSAATRENSPGGTPTPPSPVPDASAVNTSPILGGSIVGVGSKIDRSSVIRFHKAKNYRLFEFIWDPVKELNAAGLPPAGAAPGRPGDPLTPSPQPDPVSSPKPQQP